MYSSISDNNYFKCVGGGGRFEGGGGEVEGGDLIWGTGGLIACLLKVNSHRQLGFCSYQNSRLSRLENKYFYIERKICKVKLD